MREILFVLVAAAGHATDPIVLITSIILALLVQNKWSLFIGETILAVVLLSYMSVLAQRAQMNLHSIQVIGMPIATIGVGFITFFAKRLFASKNISNVEHEKEELFGERSTPRIAYGPEKQTTPTRNEKAINNAEAADNPKLILKKSQLASVNKQILDDFPSCKALFHYSKEAGKVWAEVQRFPTEQRIDFLQNLEQDPKQNLEKLAEQTRNNLNLAEQPFEDEELNAQYQKACEISPNAGLKFKNTIETFGENVNASEVLQTLKFQSEALEALIQASRATTIEDVSRRIAQVGYKLSEGQIVGVGWIERPVGERVPYTGIADLRRKILDEIEAIEQL